MKAEKIEKINKEINHCEKMIENLKGSKNEHLVWKYQLRLNELYSFLKEKK